MARDCKIKRKIQKGLLVVGVVLFSCLFINLVFAEDKLPISSVSASSYSGSHTASGAIDNDFVTAWKGDPKQSNWWLRLDLGRIDYLNKISIFWQKNHASPNYAIQASLDDKNWTNLHTGLFSKAPKATNNPYQEDYTLSGWYRYLRIYIYQAQDTHPVIHEVKLYGFQDTSPPKLTINPVNSPTNQNVVLSYSVTDDFSSKDGITISGDNSPYIQEDSYNVTLTARDLAGNSANSSVNFVIDKTPPKIVITSPQEDAVIEDAQVRFEGTVDSVLFSEIRTLSKKGENVLTKTAQDLAGNSVSASVRVYFYPGQIISPEGGEVNSPDGQVKVVIPQGALSGASAINMLPVDLDTLKGTNPANTVLLSAIECKPSGLVFNKPVQIIYTLPQAEIPGTAVELGLYDPAQDKIISTGQNSVVPTDGYTLGFSVTHFSVYVALKSMLSQGAPIGAGIKIPLPDMFTGAFGHAVPLTLPPGRKGIQPALSLTCRSSNPNSWVGLGYSLNPGYIVRSTRLGPPTYVDTQDTFYFVTDAGTTEMVHLVDNLYQAKIESGFTKFFKEPDDSWRVVGKDGSSLRFGQTSGSKETSNQGTYSWNISKAVDTNGNYIEYKYIKDQGKSYLSRIDYTGNEVGISPANTVEFFLEPRDDIPSSYISGTKIATAKRLKEIQVKVNSDLVWSYVLEYEYSQDTNRSLLKSVTQYGSDGKSLPTQTFTYQKAR